MKLINKNKFAAVALDANSETFVIHIVVFYIQGINMAIHPSWIAQI